MQKDEIIEGPGQSGRQEIVSLAGQAKNLEQRLFGQR
jgi:hypothetical protein